MCSCALLAQWNCWHVTTLNEKWTCASLHSPKAIGWPFSCAMTGALVPQHLSQCNDVKFCCASSTIAVVLPSIWIVKANENRNSYGNTIELNFLLKGLNLLLKSVGKQHLPSAFPCEDMNAFVYMNVIPKCHSLASYGTGIRVLFGWQAKFYSVANTLIPNRVRGAIFDLVGSFGINIGGDPACVPLSREGLSKATTCKPHRTCNMWMTCVCASTKYAHAKELTEFDGVQDRRAYDFPQSSSRIDCSTCGWNGDAPPSNPGSWGCCRPALLKNEVNHGTTSTSKRVQDWRPHFR